jgi:hypothetical protein
MFALVLLIIVGIVVVTVVPPVVLTVVRTFGRVTAIDEASPRFQASVESRLTRIEEAIDAMAVQIDRLRTLEERRYVSPGATSAEDTSPDDRLLRRLPPPPSSA